LVSEATAIATPAIETESAATLAPADNVAVFAKLLRKENLGDEAVLETPKTDGQKNAAKPTAAEQSPDIEAIKTAFMAGDAAKMAELLGENPKDTKVGNTRWAEFRRAARAKENELKSEREHIENERAKVQQLQNQVYANAGTLQKATEYLANEDYGSFLEIATGKPLDQVLEILTHDLVDPSKREIRKLRQETEAERNHRAQLEQQQAQQRAQAEQARAIQDYKTNLKTELVKDDDLADWVSEYGDEFIQAVFYYQSQSWDGQKTISTQKAAEKVIEDQSKKHSRFSLILERRGLKSPSNTSRDVKSKAEQGSQGARLSPRKSTTQSQGGSGGPTRPLSAQERIAYFAKQLKLENANN
jgi:hypothetical protein